MYLLFLACLLALLLPSCFAAWPDSPFFGPHTAVTPFSNLTIYKPGKNYTTPGVLYARTLELEGGVLLATWENFSPERRSNIDARALHEPGAITYLYSALFEQANLPKRLSSTSQFTKALTMERPGKKYRASLTPPTNGVSATNHSSIYFRSPLVDIQPEPFSSLEIPSPPT